MITLSRDIQIQFGRFKSITMLVAAMGLAGSSVVAGKMLCNTSPVFVTTFLSLLVAFMAMVPLMAGRFHELLALTRDQLIYLILQGVCGIVLFRIFILYGLQSTSAVQAGIITGTTPAVLALLSILLLGERPDLRKIATVLLAMAGCVILNLFSAADEANRASLIGGLLVLAAVCSECLFTIFRKRISDTVSATTNTTVLIFFSMLIVALPAYVQAQEMNALSTGDMLAIVYYGLFATVLAYLLWTGAVGDVDGSTAGVCSSAMPASSMLLAVLVLGEQLHWYHLFGCLMIISGIVLSSLSGNGRSKEQ